MVTRNPDCDNGFVEDDPHGEGAFMWSCGCGAAAGGFPSKSKAKEAQRLHRFPTAESRRIRDEQIDQIAEAFDVPRDLLESPTQTSLPTPVLAAQRPTQIAGGPFQITFTADDHAAVAQRVRDELAARPCLAGHRPAYLTSEGVACGVCGTPM